MYRRLILGVLALLVAASTASASVQIDDKLVFKGTTSYSQDGGGEFRFEHWANDGTRENPSWVQPVDFYTFCAQLGEVIQFDTTYYVVDIRGNQNSGGDLINDFGQWVYYGYSGTLEANNAVPNRVPAGTPPNLLDTQDEGGTIQWAIWAALGVDPAFDLNTTQQTLYDSWATPYATDCTPGHDWYDFKANNLGKDPVAIAWLDTDPYGSGESQDQMVIVPGGLYDIPEPASLIVWSLLGAGSWLGLRVWRRRRGPVGRRPWLPENRTAILEIIECGAHK